MLKRSHKYSHKQNSKQMEKNENKQIVMNGSENERSSGK